MEKKKIAIYNGPGARNIRNLVVALKLLKIPYIPLDKKELKEKISSFQVFVMPGGSTGKIVSSLSKNNFYQTIKDFVSKGGKYIGICSGAYLAPKDCILSSRKGRVREKGLGIIDAKCLREKVPRRKPRLRKIVLKKHSLTKNTPKELDIWYRNGPAIIPGKGVKIVATYENNLGAIAYSKFGKGKVIIISPHPEGNIERNAHPKKLRTLNLLKNAIDY